MPQVLDDPSVLYNHEYQAASFGEKSILAIDAIAAALVARFKPRSHVDMGCGPGLLVGAMEALGVDSSGFDGSKACTTFHGKIATQDLRVPTVWEREWDLVTCFDVVEHIESAYGPLVCENLVRACKPGGYVVLGPAPEGQDGLGHVNLQHPCWWIARMNVAGARVLPLSSEELRAEIRSREAHSHLWWIAKNLMVFVRTV